MSVLTLVVGFVPVLLFLAALILMDSYKLVTRRSVALALGAGVLAAGISLLLNPLLLAGGIDPTLLRRYWGPLLEEIVKAIYVVYLIRSAHVGFLVDAAILGFAVGTGFAVVENVYYASVVRDLGLGLWLVRGLGTAVMHGLPSLASAGSTGASAQFRRS